MKHTGLNYNNGDFYKVGGSAMSPDDGQSRPKGTSKTLSRRQMQYRTRRTCADGVQGESAGEERVCEFLLLPVDNSVLHHERQGIDCRDPGP